METGILSHLTVGLITACWSVIMICAVIIALLRHYRITPRSGAALDELAHDLRLILDRLPDNLKHEEVIAPGGLYVGQVCWWVDQHGKSGYRVRVLGCKPDRNYLKEGVQVLLRERGWPGVEVVIEWA